MRKIRLSESKTIFASTLQSKRINGRRSKGKSIFYRKPKIISILALLFLVAQDCKAVDGALKGVFSVSETKKVVFSKGNLQKVKEGDTWTWKFADDQKVYFGESQTEENKDMFAYNEWADATSLIEAGWYVMSHEEWKYVINDRSVSNTLSLNNKSCILATVGETGETVKGLILFPDNYIHPEGTDFYASSAYEATVSLDGWQKMENAGCVFIPAAGYNNGNWQNVNSAVAVSSSTENGTNYYTPYFTSSNFNPDDNSWQTTLTSVRMVKASVTLTDADDITELETYAGQTVKVNYTRSFTKDKASTVCLPFAFPKASASGTFYTFTGITKVDGNFVAQMTEYSGANLEPNTPYLFMPSADGAVDFSGTYILPATIAADNTERGDWKFYGTYTKLTYGTNPFSGNVYGFASKAKGTVQAGEFVKATTGASVPAMRCYLKYKDGESYSGARSFEGSTGSDDIPQTIIVQLIDVEGNVTSIGTINTRTSEFTTDGWYTLDGHHLQGKPSKKGVYINNGRKVMIK